jgi:hypothetical protein
MSRIGETPSQCPARMLEYRLQCGRDVRVEECYISLSALGYLAGGRDAIRDDVVKRLPEWVRAQFPGDHGILIKPAPEGKLPTYTFMAVLVCSRPVSDPAADCSSLVVCWLGDDLETPLRKLIEREIRAVEWDQYAVDGWS